MSTSASQILAADINNKKQVTACIAHGLSNTLTPTYKMDEVEFAELVQTPTRNPGVATGTDSIASIGNQIGYGSKIQGIYKNHTQGTIEQYDNQYAFAVNGDGFIEVEKNGTTYYTRDGRLKINANGEWTTSDGYKVKSNFQAIPTGAKVAISETGDVTATTEDAEVTFRIQLTRFVNPSGLIPMNGNLYAMNEASSGPAETGDPGTNNFGSIVHRAKEGSNANYVDLMVRLMETHRASEASINALRDVNKANEEEANLLR